MTRVGVSGHQRLPGKARHLIVEQVRLILSKHDRPLICYTSLAEGADQLVAEEVLRLNGSIYAVVPSKNYNETFDSMAEQNYRMLLNTARWVEWLPFAEPSEEAFDAAGKWVVDHCDVLVAIWDGKPARGLGGTADAVEYARSQAKSICVIWPEGVARD